MTKQEEDCTKAIRNLEYKILDLENEISETREQILVQSMYKLVLHKHISHGIFNQVETIYSDAPDYLPTAMRDLLNALQNLHEETQNPEFEIIADLVESLGDEWFTEDWKEIK